MVAANPMANVCPVRGIGPSGIATCASKAMMTANKASTTKKFQFLITHKHISP